MVTASLNSGSAYGRQTATDSVRGGVVDSDLELALWSDYVDRLTVEITRQLTARQIDSILLKGPAIAQWLYRDGTPRPYGDADLLVSPADWRDAQAMLEEIGFERELAPLDHPGMGSMQSEAWARGPQNIDLHCTFWGMDEAAPTVWAALSEDTRRITIAGAEVKGLRPAAQVLLIAIHAAKHGDGWAVTDLERAVVQVDRTVWAGAAELARGLEAVQAFVAGLHLIESGPLMIRELGLPDTPLAEASLRAWRVPMALGLEQLSHTPGARAKLGVLWHEMFPNPAFMHWWSPLARRGRAGLVAAYVWRIAWVARHAVPAVHAWRRARRRAAVDPSAGGARPRGSAPRD